MRILFHGKPLHRVSPRLVVPACSLLGFKHEHVFAKGIQLMEFRWVVVLTLWTLLIGPILDFTHSTPTAHATRVKASVPAKATSVR